MHLQQLNDLEIPERLHKYEKKIRALLYYRYIKDKKREALRYAEIHLYNCTKQFEVIEKNEDIRIFCDKFKDYGDSEKILDVHSRKALIDRLDKAVSNETIRSIDSIAKLKGYYDVKQGQLDTNRPIYIVTRHTRRSVKVGKPQQAIKQQVDK